jgi:hypothetical protein
MEKLGFPGKKTACPAIITQNVVFSRFQKTGAEKFWQKIGVLYSNG